MLDFPPVSRDLLIVERNWKDLGRAVAYARKTAGWTQSELSALVEQKTGEAVSSRTIGTLERGEPVNDVTLNRVAVALEWAPSTPHAILDGMTHVGLAGELVPAGGTVQFSGSGQLTTGVTPVTRAATSRWNVQEPPAETTLQDVRQTIANHERDVTVAINDATDLLRELQWTLTGKIEGDDPLELIESIRSELDKIATIEHGRRWWQRQAETLLQQDPAEAFAARRGRKSQVEEPGTDVS